MTESSRKYIYNVMSFLEKLIHADISISNYEIGAKSKIRFV